MVSKQARPPLRHATVERKTLETRIRVEVTLDGPPSAQLSLGIPFLEHMLEQVARHGALALQIDADGDLAVDAHHTVEDIGITLGQAISQCLGDRAGIRRYGSALVPLDEALSRVVIDFSGRPGLVYEVPFSRARIGDFDVDLIREFFGGFVNHAAATLHIDNLRGDNSHHQAETVFKAFGRALLEAISPDAAALGVPSTKGSL